MSILDKSPYSSIFNQLYSVKERVTNNYVGKITIPVGTFKPQSEYDEIKESDMKFVTFDTVSPHDATSMCFIGTAGSQKTTLMKTITYHRSLIPNTKVGIMELKNNALSWERCNRPAKNIGALFPLDRPTMDIVSGCPSFALRGMPIEEKKKIKQMNLNPHELGDMNLLSGLGFSMMAIQNLYSMLSAGMSIEKIFTEAKKLAKTKKIRSTTYDNLVLLLMNLIKAGFIAKKDYINIDKIWDDDKAWALGFNNKEISYLSIYVQRMLTKIFDRANSMKGQDESYWIVVDDAQKAFGLSPEHYPSTQAGIDCLTQWRSLGINLIIGIQSPTLLNEEIYSDIKHFFIMRSANIDVLSKYIPNKEILREAKSLIFRPEKRESECLHVFPDRQRSERFFIANSPIAN